MGLVIGSLAAHRQSQNDIIQGPQWDNTQPPEYPQIYWVSFPKTMGLMEFCVEVLRVQATSCTNLCIHSVQSRVRYTIVILG